MKPDSTPQPFRFGQALRCTWDSAPRGPNLARSREQVVGHAPTRPSGIIWQDAVLNPKHRVSLGCWEGKKLRGMISAGTRPGHKSWEIDRLYLYGSWPSLGRLEYENYQTFSDRWDMGWYEDFCAEDAGLDLLEQVNVAVGQRAAQRIYLRLLSNSPALNIAQRSGFTPAVTETLLEGYGGNTGGLLPPKEGPLGMRPAGSQDLHGLFQLYCASAPAKARGALGLTFEQWQERQAVDIGLFKFVGCREWVADGPEGLVSWLRITRRSVFVDVETMTHPGRPDALYPALDYALAQPGIQRWLVPEYQEALADRLGNRGFRQSDQYTMMVKMVAVPALQYGMAPVEA